MKYDAEANELIISLETKQGLDLADLMLQTLFIYAVQTDEELAVIRQLQNMINGREPAVSMDLTERFFEIDA